MSSKLQKFQQVTNSQLQHHLGSERWWLVGHTSNQQIQLLSVNEGEELQSPPSVKA